MSKRVLEPAAKENADATAKPPFLYELSLDGVRKVLDDLQAAPIDNPIAASQPDAVTAAISDAAATGTEEAIPA